MVSIPAPKAAGSPKSSTVVLVVGESVTSSHVSALGYPRETTPFLQSLKGSPNALIREIYSAGKMTSVALPSFMNAIPYPDGTAQIATGATNLLRLAKNQGFATRWHTAQAKGEMAIMNTIGGRWLDAATFPTDHGFAWAESMSDFELLPYLDGIGEEKAFVVLHQRGSHAPYAALTPEAFRVFGETRLDLYDATVRAMDGFLQACLEKLARRPGKNWVLVYVSDHGQFVTQNEATQGGAEFDAFAVPLFVYSPDARLVDSAAKWFAEHAPSHYQLAVWISRLLGYDAQPVTEEVIVNNNLLSGGAGWVSVSEDKTVTSHRW